MKRLSLFACTLVLMSSVWANADNIPTTSTQDMQTRERLLEQVRFGEALFRDDIIEDALTRLYRISPDDPDGLVAQVRLNTRLGQIPQAREFQAHLEKIAPDSAQATEGALLIELTTEKTRSLLSRARLFAAAGRVDEAIEIYDKILKGIYPTPELAQEYWSAKARQTNGLEPAIAALTKLTGRFSNHPAILKPLINFHFQKNDPASALYLLTELSHNAAERPWAAQRQYEYLQTLDVSDYSRRLLTEFVTDFADQTQLIGLAQTRLTRQNELLNDPAWHAGRDGMALIEAEQNPQKALNQLLQALKAYPNDVEIIGSLGVAYLRVGDRVKALEYFKRAMETEERDDMKYRWLSLIKSTEHWLLLSRAEQAEKRSQWRQAIALYGKALENDKQDLFALLGLANAYQALGDSAQAWQYLMKAASVNSASDMVQRAFVRHTNSYPLAQRERVLAQAPGSLQESQLFREARREYRVDLLHERWQTALDAGDTPLAIDIMREAQVVDPSNVWLTYTLATTLRDEGREAEAMEAFEIHRVHNAGKPATHYAHGLLLASLGRWDEARLSIHQIPRARWSEEMVELGRRIDQTKLLDRAQALDEAGERQNAITLLEKEGDSTDATFLLAQWAFDAGDYARSVDLYREVEAKEGLSANGFRGLARAWASDGRDIEQALDWYGSGMVQAGLLEPKALEPVRDNVAFTRAMRHENEDDWLRHGLRSDSEKLYQSRNTTLTVHEDFGWRRDGTPGLSDLSANTMMVQLDHPLGGGMGFVRMDYVRMNAGTLETDSTGKYRGEFGTCRIGLGCDHGLKQTAAGTSLAVGWRGERLSVDVGTTPLGFKVRNWVGGISYTGDLGELGWRLTASRRPMSNSVLSYAGATDPASGQDWGGVTATGGALSLSWDRGEANGVWADLSAHALRGKNVENNFRIRLMGGYYRRLINKRNEFLTVGVNMMHWRYQNDLGGYSFRDGGYYSPKEYYSVSFPVRYARRTDNWSFVVQTGVSLSNAKSHDGSRSNGVGYFVNGIVERRLTNHLILGLGVDLQHSENYTPSRAMLYLRYTFKPWSGSLPLPPDPLIPYADFK